MRFLWLWICSYILQGIGGVVFLVSLIGYVDSGSQDDLLAGLYLGTFLYIAFLAFVLVLAGGVIRVLISIEYQLHHANVLARSKASRSAPNDTHRSAEEMFNRGYKAYQKGDYQMALRILSDTISAEPSYTEAYTYRALTHRALGHDDLARRDMTTAKELETHE